MVLAEVRRGLQFYVFKFYEEERRKNSGQSKARYQDMMKLDGGYKGVGDADLHPFL